MRSAQLFLYATVAFIVTAGSLFLELPSREGLLGRIGWAGLLVAGPLAVVLVILALRRYSREAAVDSAPPPDRPPPPGASRMADPTPPSPPPAPRPKA